MTKTRQDKTGKSGAVELNDAALDQAAGGGEEIHYTITLTNGRIAAGDGSVRSLKDTI